MREKTKKKTKKEKGKNWIGKSVVSGQQLCLGRQLCLGGHSRDTGGAARVSIADPLPRPGVMKTEDWWTIRPVTRGSATPNQANPDDGGFHSSDVHLEQ